MDFTIYWFMFPVWMMIATAAMLSGIGGAAMFAPIFFIIFPLLWPEYPLASPAAAIGVALLIETFRFFSGFVGYYRKRLIDFRGSLQFIAVSVPVAVLGAVVLLMIDQPSLLKGAYAALMLVLAFIMMRDHAPVDQSAQAGDAALGPDDARPMQSVTDRTGAV
jgi:uncharacterized membrane protein YfcA